MAHGWVMGRTTLPIRGWEVGHSGAQEVPPDRFVEALVPGAVQLDWARAEGWGPFWYGDNVEAYKWMEDRIGHAA